MNPDQNNHQDSASQQICLTDHIYFEKKAKIYNEIESSSKQSVGVRLTAEIEEFVNKINVEMSSSRKLRKMLVDQLQTRFQEEGIISQLQIYGSFQTELDLTWSDIDLVVDPTPGNEQFALTQIKDSLDQMQKEANSWIKEIHFYD